MSYNDAGITFVETSELSIDILQDIRNWRNDENISKYMYGNHKITQEEHSKWLSALPKRNDLKFFVVFKNEKPIGTVYFNNISSEHRNSEWGFYIYPPQLAGKGYGVAIEFVALNFAFDILKLNKLNCEVLDFNLSVIKLHKKFGFVEEGRKRKQIFKNNEFVDVVMLGLLSSEWRANKEKMKRFLFRSSGGGNPI